MTATRSHLAQALLRWLRRYLPAELVSTACALVGGITAPAERPVSFLARCARAMIS